MRHLLLSSLLFVFTSNVLVASDPINVEAVINIVDSSDSSKVAAALKKANEILGQAGIKLVPVKVNKPFNTGNNDNKLTDAEGYKAVEEGEQELDNTCGSGNGLKVTIADDVWIEKPSTSGWSIHRKPVVFAESNNDVNSMGRTIAHEICHSLTLGYDLYDANDANDIMYGYRGGGTTISEAQKEEIRKGAKKRVPSWFGRNSRRAWKWVKKTGKAILDALDDLLVNNVPTPIAAFESLNFLDIRTVSAFCESPDQPGAELVFEIMLNGDFPAESFFDITYKVDVNTPRPLIPPTPEPNLIIRVWNETGIVQGEANYHNTVTGITTPVPLLIHTNERHYSPIEEYETYVPIIANSSLEATIPLSIMGIDSTVFVDGLVIHTTQQATILSAIEFLNPGDIVIDETEPMEIKISQPCQCREVTMISSGLAGTNPQWPDKPKYVDFYGCDFNGDVTLYINDDIFGTVVADSNGNVNIRADVSGLERGVYEILLQEQLNYDGSTPDRADYSMGYLDLRPDTQGDVDDDGKVNLIDLAKMAESWLI